jgi:hypothetical protein
MTCTNEQLEKIDNAMGALHGYVEQMGGGLTAWWINLGPAGSDEPSKRYALVTHHESDHEGDPDEPVWIAGLYSENYSIGDAEEYRADVTFDAAVEIVRGWRLIELRAHRRATIVDRIARDFVKLLREGLSDAAWGQLRFDNIANIGTGCCASHDFCDANMPMAEAFERHVGHEPEGDCERDASFWNDAWRLAQRRDLTEQGSIGASHVLLDEGDKS